MSTGDNSDVAQGPFFSVPIDFENLAEQAVPHSERLLKHGRFGTCLANNRRGVVRLVVYLLVCAAAAFVVLLLGASWRMGVRITAAGLSGTLPMTAPWTSEQVVYASLLEKASHTVKIGDALVINVVEPVGRVETDMHMLLLVHGVDRTNTDGRVDAGDVQRGYMQWKPFGIPLSANFTLQHVSHLMRMQNSVGGGEHTCVCFVEYGLPHNAVYVPASDETLYGPRIESFSDERVKLRSLCRFRKLLEKWNASVGATASAVNAMPIVGGGGGHDNETEIEERSKSGTVSYIDQRGAARRSVFGLPLFPCIAHCVSLYEQLRDTKLQQ